MHAPEFHLERQPINGAWLENIAIILNTGSECVEICRASDTHISNTPYAADEVLTFKAELRIEPNELQLWLQEETREISTAGTSSKKLSVHTSTDGGRTWTRRAITSAAELRELESKALFEGT